MDTNRMISNIYHYIYTSTSQSSPHVQTNPRSRHTIPHLVGFIPGAFPLPVSLCPINPIISPPEKQLIQQVVVAATPPPYSRHAAP